MGDKTREIHSLQGPPSLAELWKCVQGFGWAALHPNYPGSGKAFSPWKGPEQLCGKATHPFELVYPDFLNVLN